MSAISSTAPPSDRDGDESLPPVPAADIDASCRGPLLVMFGSALVWLVVASVLRMIATLKFHQPGILADCAWFTYGRVYPAHLNAFIYGFAAQAALGVMLWILCRLGRTKLECGVGILVGTKIWNIGVTLGLLGILYGESTGYEWLEMPRYGSAPMFVGYLIIGLAAMMTFHRRRERSLYLSQWYFLAALFWFPWIYVTAEFLLVVRPVRGVVQSIIDAWYINNLGAIWFGFIGLGTIFYFVPKLVEKPLHSRHLGTFGFLTLALFGSWGGAAAAGAPMPAWVPALSTAGAMLTVIPILAVAINLYKTIGGDFSKFRGNVPLKFMFFAGAAYVLAGLSLALVSFEPVSEVTNFTWVTPAQTWLLLYGFLAMTLFGAIYYILPRLTGLPLSPKLVTAQFWLALLGIVIYVVPLVIGGIEQGLAMKENNTVFLSIVQGTLTFIRASTLGDLMMVVGHFVLLGNFGLTCYQMSKQARAAFKTGWLANVKAGVAS